MATVGVKGLRLDVPVADAVTGGDKRIVDYR